jgi:branched-chain amino acid transport system substrate-binding protein
MCPPQQRGEPGDVRRDLSRENIMHEAESFHQVRFPWLLPGITLNTSRTDHQPIKDMRETRFNGKTWELLDDLN